MKDIINNNILEARSFRMINNNTSVICKQHRLGLRIYSWRQEQ